MRQKIGVVSPGNLYNGGKTKIRREWRGLSDSWYDYRCWAKNWGRLIKFITNPQCFKGFFRYRWMMIPSARYSFASASR